MRYFYSYFLVATALLRAQNPSPVINPLPSREFGQPQLLQTLSSIAPNLVEGRELDHPTSIAFDTSVSPPILYVVDQFNNRVLAWKNATGLGVCGTSAPLTCGLADLVIGQLDKSSTFARGPSAGGGALSSGLSGPSAVAVDSNGNLYVADSGNNRILRYPAPFNQTGSLLAVDLVIGQASVTSGYLPNQNNTTTPTAHTLFLNVAVVDHVGPVGMAFDSAGNLWVPDVGNSRVLRFPVQNLAANTSQPAADVVLGQPDFVSSGNCVVSPNNCYGAVSGQLLQQNTSGLALPSSVTFDQAGNLYVADQILRVVQYAPPVTSSIKASHVLGILPAVASGQTQLPYPNAYSLGLQGTSGLFPPMGIATLGNNLYVSDPYENRIAIFDITPSTVAGWPSPTSTTAPSPQISTVIGQPDLVSGNFNKKQPEPDATTLGGPTAIAFNGTDLWVADSSNNRVTSFPSQGAQGYAAATRLVGQLDFPFNTANLIEGREVFFVVGTGYAGMVVDTNSNPPHLYVADSLNNRVLGFKDVRTVGQNTRADLVIGQRDFFRSLINNPNNDATKPTDTGLNSPIGLVVDANGDLFVADSGNGRVLRFPAPFSQTPGATQRANLVLGQQNFNVHVPDASAQEMKSPFGLALLSFGTLAVSDASHNRVLIFKRAQGQDFTNFQAATHVLGQSNFFTTTAATGTSTTPPNNAGMNSPRGVASDNSDRLYVCDSLNNRVLIFTSSTELADGAPSAFQIYNLSTPQGVIVNQISSEFWVANTGNNTLFRFPRFEFLVLNPNVLSDALGAPSPVALTLDGAGNLIVAEASNRVTFYFAAMFWRHAGNFNTQPLTPGMLAAVGQLGANFKFTTNTVQSEPWPPTMSDLQLTIAGTPARIFRVDSSALWFMVPMNAPSSGNADFVLTQPSTGAVLAAGTFPMAAANPGFFTASQNGLGQVAARNDDQVTANGPSTPVGRGKYISLYMTGAGYVPNAPADGVSPSSAINTPARPLVIINGLPVADSDVLYSGLGGFPGGWVINVIVPDSTPPGNNIVLAVLMRDVPSNIGGSSNADGSPGGDVRILNVIAVK